MSHFATLMFASWNLISVWLVRIDALHTGSARAAAPGVTARTLNRL